MATTSAVYSTCPAPTIASIAPNTWFTGSTYNPVTITGTGFVTPAQATSDCPASTLSIATPSGAVVAIASPTVVSDTQITASVTPPAGEATETATVTVSGSPAATIPVQIEGLSAIVTDTSDIMNGIVTVKLTAPSGTTGGLNLDVNGSDSSGLELSQAAFPALAPGSQDLKLPSFDAILPGIYPMANGNWDALVPGASSSQLVTVPNYTLPTPWTYFRKIFYTQYNVPHESSCSGGDVDAWIVSTSVVKGKTTCNFKKIKLNAQFITATWMNGTGIDLDGDILKNAAAVHLGDMQRCAGLYPNGAIGHSQASGNTFEVVSSVAGSCNTTLVADQSLAMPCEKNGIECPVVTLSGVKALSCGDRLNLDSGSYSTASMRTVEDLCPACSDSSTFHGADAHIDAFSPNTSCTGRAVGTLGFFYTSYPTN